MVSVTLSSRPNYRGQDDEYPSVGAPPPLRVDIEANLFPRTQTNRPLCLQHPRVSFNEANGDITKHPAAYIHQESSRPKASDACLSSRRSRFPPPPVLSSDFSVSLLKWK